MKGNVQLKRGGGCYELDSICKRNNVSIQVLNCMKLITWLLFGRAPTTGDRVVCSVNATLCYYLRRIFWASEKQA